MSNIKVRYQPLVVGANATVSCSSTGIGGFLAKTSGTITIATRAATPITLVDAVAVTAGLWVDMPFYVGPEGFTVTTAGGASGTLGV